MTQTQLPARSLPGAAGSARPKTLIVGLGNPILGDDGIGWRVAERIQARLQAEPVGAQDLEVDCLALGGLSLMERLVGYDEAILVDAIHLGQSPVGSLLVVPLADIPDTMAGHLSSSHDTSLKTAIQIGKSLGAHLPDKITVVGVETSNSYDFSEELSPPVRAAVPAAVQMVMSLLDIQG